MTNHSVKHTLGSVDHSIQTRSATHFGKYTHQRIFAKSQPNPVLDDAEVARSHGAGTFAAIEWALGLMRNLERWQEAFA